MKPPSATYRVQFHKDFRFQHAQALLPYLEQMGISHLYASPVFQARKGSMHGYDITNPACINPELGSAADFDALADELHRRGMFLLLDIVPNHLAAGPENPWWMDVLENGPASAYAAFFDVEWGHRTPTVQDRIVLPILGEPYGTALEEQKIQLRMAEHGFEIVYGSTPFPLDPATLHPLLAFRLEGLLAKLQREDAALKDYGLLLERAERLPARNLIEWEAVELRRRDAADLKTMLRCVYDTHPVIKNFLDENIRTYNGTKGDPGSFDPLDHLLNGQAYRLTFWRAARERINYRRFFDVTDLIAIRAKDPQVFQATHELTLGWLAGKKVDGLRIDHVDGLYDPLAYLAQLQARASREAGHPVYIVVEKILSGTEQLPSEWPVAGMTGYEFLGAVNNVFVHPEGLEGLTSTYYKFTGDSTGFYERAYQQKKKMMDDLFAGEIRSLGLHLANIAERYRHAQDLSPEALRRALQEVTASMPVYRTYTRDFRTGSHDREFSEDAVAAARRRAPEINPACFDFIRRVLLTDLPEDEDALRFLMRWQQLTGPVMAKGVEDTTLYLYNRLVSMNDVGGSPEPLTPEGFHRFNDQRRRQWPGTMNATSTHDTKRSEDVRARLNVLSEAAGEWSRTVTRWSRWNRALAGAAFPDADPNQEYLLYQTLAGVWPLDDAITPELVDRVKAYMTKSAREAKAHTSWLQQDNEYEKSMLEFTEAILKESAANRFLPHFRRFEQRIAFYGALNSLAQTVLKMVSPGVPDFYQGSTVWDFSLVDPDNRRPAQMAANVNELPEAAAGALLENWRDGRIKAFVILKTLALRNEHPNLFAQGDYFGLQAKGTPAAEHTMGLGRRHGAAEWALAIVPRFASQLTALEKWPLGRRLWRDAWMGLPEGAPVKWRNIFTGEAVTAKAGRLAVGDALETFPVAVLTPEG